ncbi:Calmodulin-binding transcription activator 1, partial [Penaeus vannamei]
CIYGCYVHSAILPTFHRRCYWLLQNPDIVLVHYLNVPYPDDNKLVMASSISLWADKKEWTKEELISQLKPMFFSEDEPDLNNELEISPSCGGRVYSQISKVSIFHILYLTLPLFYHLQLLTSSLPPSPLPPSSHQCFEFGYLRELLSASIPCVTEGVELKIACLSTPVPACHESSRPAQPAVITTVRLGHTPCVHVMAACCCSHRYRQRVGQGGGGLLILNSGGGVGTTLPHIPHWLAPSRSRRIWGSPIQSPPLPPSSTDRPSYHTPPT